MINCRTECPCVLFRRWNGLSKVQLVYLEALKHQESYGWWFLWVEELKRLGDFTGRKTLNKLEAMYLEFNLKEGKFNWCSKKQKADLF